MNDNSDNNSVNVPINVNVSVEDVATELVSEGGQVDYGKLIEENSERIRNIPDEHTIFISHASAGEGAYPDEKQFVLTLYKFLIASYPDKVYLDLIKNPKIIYTEVLRAAQRSTYGVFICSPRYINIFHGERKEPYVREYEIISIELNTFLAKQRRHGFCMIPIRFGVESDAFSDRSPLGGGVDTISIENEVLKTHLEKAEYVSSKIIELIKEAEAKKVVSNI